MATDKRDATLLKCPVVSVSRETKPPLICRRFLDNPDGEDRLNCSDLHTRYPFLWQGLMEDKWHDFYEKISLGLESHFRNPQADGTRMKFPSCVVSGQQSVPDSDPYIDFDGMTLSVENDIIKIRRLSTPSMAVEPGPYSTIYNWFFEVWDNMWVRYGEVLEPSEDESSQKTDTSSDEIERQYSLEKKQSIHTQYSGNKYVLDLVNMTQTHTQTNVVHRIRRRVQAGPLTPGRLPSTQSKDSQKEQKSDNSVENCAPEVAKTNSNIDSLVSALTSEEVIKKLAAALHAMQTNNSQHKNESSTNLSATSGSEWAEESNAVNTNSCKSNVSTSKCSHEWHFQDDDGSWVKYGKQNSNGHSSNSDKVEIELKKNPAAYFQIQLNDSPYPINFCNMTETNSLTRRVRNVRRVTNGAKPQPDVKKVSNYGSEWYFQDDDGFWVKYGSRNVNKQTGTSDDLEKHYLQNPAIPFNFKLKTCDYVVNFNHMIQTNTTSGKIRSVRRIAAGPPPPTPEMPQPQLAANSKILQTMAIQSNINRQTLANGRLIHVQRPISNVSKPALRSVSGLTCYSGSSDEVDSSNTVFPTASFDALDNEAYTAVSLNASSIE